MAGIREIDTNTIQPYVPFASAWVNSAQFCQLKAERITTDPFLFSDTEEDDAIELSCGPSVPTRVNIADALTAVSSVNQGLPIINIMMTDLLCDWASADGSLELTNPLPLKLIEIIKSRKFGNSMTPASARWLSLSPYVSKRSSISDKFYTLKAEWERETVFQSMAFNIAMHPAYQQIIGMGVTALPLIFQEMLKRPAHWFWALRSITGEDPILPNDRGDISRMTETWLDWGRENSYL